MEGNSYFLPSKLKLLTQTYFYDYISNVKYFSDKLRRRQHSTNQINESEKQQLHKKKHQCTQCENRFYQKGNLNGHMLSHTDEKSYRCEQCEKRFVLKQPLKRHMMDDSWRGKVMKL